jgi:hypothetical protein
MKTTNELKKGTKILLAYGQQHNDLAGLSNFEKATNEMYCIGLGYKPWEAKLMDNARGNIRMAEVYGFETEIGSVYSHDILAYFEEVFDEKANLINSGWQKVEHTASQLALKAQLKGGGLQ